MRIFAVLAFAIVFGGPALAANAPVLKTNTRVQFVFHNAFLMNLHHFLYDAATLGSRPARAEWQLVSEPADKLVLDEALAYYRTNYASSHVFDENMTAMKSALSVADDLRSPGALALPPALRAVLERAAPVYARTIWPVHERANGQWIRQAAALDAVFGADAEAGIERHMGHAFPTKAIRVDVVYYSGNREGAYTMGHTVLSSARADYQGMAALEMLYHEAAHIDVNDTVIEAINAQLKAAGRAPDRGLWHAVHFYTVGQVAKEVLKRRANIDYQPYADKNGLFKGPFFAAFVPVIEGAWRPYMQGELSFKDAVQGMVERLPSVR
jgi:hypothetical protein